ncbi:MAG: hypothetical protein ACF8MF_05050 [Phycisphaerales bacterium JB052]
MSLARCLILFLFLLAWAPSTGCSGGDPAPHVQLLTHEAEDAQSGARLMLNLHTDSIGIADRLWVEARWSWPDTISASLAPPEWGETDWTLIETIDEPVSRRGDRYEVSSRWLIEPFLPGEYIVPSPVVLTESNSTTNELSVEPFTVSVEGVLPVQDTGQLNPLATPVLPETQDEASPALWVWVVFCVAVAALTVLIIARRGSHGEPDETVYAQLKRIENDDQLDQGQAFEILDRALTRLDPRLRQTTEFAEMIRACDRARFAREPQQHVSPARIARHALELLGHDTTPSLTGGAT